MGSFNFRNLKDSNVSAFVLLSLGTVLEDCIGFFLGPRRKVMGL